MEESPSATYSDEEQASQLQTLLEENERLAESLRWNAAILAVLLQQEGGAVEITKEDLLAIKWNDVNTTVRLDEERDVFIVENFNVE